MTSHDKNVKDVLESLNEHNIIPTVIVEDPLNNVTTFSFNKNDKYIFVEIYDDGDMLVGYFDNDIIPIVFKYSSSTDQIKKVVEKVCRLL